MDNYPVHPSVSGHVNAGISLKSQILSISETQRGKDKDEESEGCSRLETGWCESGAECAFVWIIFCLSINL